MDNLLEEDFWAASMSICFGAYGLCRSGAQQSSAAVVEGNGRGHRFARKQNAGPISDRQAPANCSPRPRPPTRKSERGILAGKMWGYAGHLWLLSFPALGKIGALLVNGCR
jgi:hypothetical protein